MEGKVERIGRGGRGPKQQLDELKKYIRYWN
jgi:hypothetical protein